MNEHIAIAGIKSCLREQNHVIKQFYAKPKVSAISFMRVYGLKVSRDQRDSLYSNKSKQTRNKILALV